MTNELDKQIIIDGVDVADCEHINACDKKMKCVILQDDVCETNPYCEGFNCYYKQLKRKEQECEELKRYKSLFEKTRDLWNKASKTNYKLLDEIEDLKDSLKRTICQSECYRYKEAEKLKATLTEIKEIAEKYKNLNFGEQQYCCSEILQTINKYGVK